MGERINERIGFIGAGNMATAIAGGLIKSGLAVPDQLIASDAVDSQLVRIARELGIRATPSNCEVAAASDVIILSTKPYQVVDVCTEISEAFGAGRLFISICAGVPTSLIEAHLGGAVRVVRVMPNTPALVGCGATAIAGGSHVSEEHLEFVARLFRAVGVVVTVPEKLMDLVTGLTGSGPAYVYLLGEALIDAAAELGLSRADADTLVRQLLKGAGLLASESDKPLADLRAAVTTKGGTTEAGLSVLENGGFRKLVRDCVAQATERSKELATGD